MASRRLIHLFKSSFGSARYNPNGVLCYCNHKFKQGTSLKGILIFTSSISAVIVGRKLQNSTSQEDSKGWFVEGKLAILPEFMEKWTVLYEIMRSPSIIPTVNAAKLLGSVSAELDLDL